MRLLWCVLLAIGLTAADAAAQQVARDVPYVPGGHARQVLDVYAPGGATNAPVVFWIHGGGWQTGHKGLVARKPQAFTDAGYVFVSINHRLLPEVEMRAIIEDVASAMKWVHDNIAGYGGDPSRVLVMGHSSGGQLAAITCTDHRYLARHGLSLSMIRGCVPVDADTFDIPAIIEMAETRARVHGLPMPTYGHRQKFGNDEAKHRDFSAVTHVAPDKGIPPFLIVYVAEQPDNTAQARRFSAVLTDAGIPVTLVGARDTTHSRVNDAIGLADDPVTEAIFTFAREAVAPR
jgi:arylformamidase